MGRRSVAILLALVVMFPLAQVASAQDDSETLCIWVIGTAPAEGWDDDSLAAAIADGSVVPFIRPGEECAVTAASPTTEPPADAALPIEVVEYGMSVDKKDLGYAVILRNPNPSTWATNYMTVRIDVLDGAGDLVTTSDESVTILPGQTIALAGNDGDAKGAATLEVAVANSDSDWEEIDVVPGDLTFTGVKTKKGSYSSMTTGRIESTFEDQLEDVRVTAVFRDKAGKLLGGNYTYVDFIPAGGKASFELYVPDVIPFRSIASTEMYYQFRL